MNKMYEGLFIFPETLDEEQLEKSIENVKEELLKLKGTVEKSTRLGKKYFTRILKKHKSGYYVVLVFSLDGNKIDDFKSRLNLGTDVFRSQFTLLNKSEEVVQEAN